jgi:hypothetical protein
MKFSVINTSLQTGIVKGIDLLPVETFVPTTLKKYTQHYIFSRNISNELYTFVIRIFVSGSRCETEVAVTKFNKELQTLHIEHMVVGQPFLEY